MNHSSAYTAESFYQVLGAWRMPGYVLPTLCFPAFFYIFFGLLMETGGGGINLASYLIATYGTFGIIAPALFGFGAGVAAERGQGWLRLKLASPMPPGAYVVAKLVTAMLFALSVVIVLFALGTLFGGVTMVIWRWLLLALCLVLGSIPFCALGLWIGLNSSPQAAPAIVNLVYLPMSFLSGLWVPLMFLPDLFQYVAWILPPFHLAQIALAVVGFDSAMSPWVHLSVLLIFTLLFMALALRSWRRDTET